MTFVSRLIDICSMEEFGVAKRITECEERSFCLRAVESMEEGNLERPSINTQWYYLPRDASPLLLRGKHTVARFETGAV